MTMSPNPKQMSLRFLPTLSRNGIVAIVILIIALGGYSFFALRQPLPEITPSKITIAESNVTTSAIAWPAYGEAAVAVNGYGVVAEGSNQDSVPMASITKAALALMVVQEKPLKTGEPGPTFTITPADVTLFNEYLAQNASVVPVRAGTTLTQYQMLQALLLPSGGNIAHMLAVWAYGSVENYITSVNAFMTKNGLTKTRIVDASGLSAETVSSAHDLALLGQMVMAEPVLAEIVGQSEATLPVAGLVRNYNVIMGQENIVGLKTGTTDEAGGCFLFATKQTIDGEEYMVTGAIMGATSRAVVLNDTVQFIRNNKAKFKKVTVAKANDAIAEYKIPWGGSVKAVAKSDGKIIVTDNKSVTHDTNVTKLQGGKDKGTEVGTLTITAGNATQKIPLVLDSPIREPSVLWRLLHP